MSICLLNLYCVFVYGLDFTRHRRITDTHIFDTTKKANEHTMESVESKGSAVAEAMQWIDSPNLNVRELQRAYDLLCDEVAVVAMEDFVLRDQLIASCISGESLAWWTDQMDLYRAIITVSFLLLQMKTFDTKSARTLQNTIEQALLILKLLAGTDKEERLGERLIPSRYPLLNALLQEPLLPLSRLDRMELWHVSSEPIEADEEEGDENGIMIPSRQELLREETELIKLARKPLPPGLATQEDSSKNESIAWKRQLPNAVLCQAKVKLSTKSASLSRDSHLVLYRCGCLVQKGAREGWEMTLNTTWSIVNIDLDQGESSCQIRIQSLSETANEGDGGLRISELSFQIDSGQRGPQWDEALTNARREIQVREDLHRQVLSAWRAG